MKRMEHGALTPMTTKEAVALREQMGILVKAGCIRMPTERSRLEWIERCAKWGVASAHVPGTVPI